MLTTCQKCKGTWFETIEVNQIDDGTVSYRQKPLTLDTHILIRCVRCSDLQELLLQETTGDKHTKASYSDLTKQLSDESWKKPVEKKNEGQG